MFQNMLERVSVSLTNVEVDVNKGFFGASKIETYDKVAFELEDDLLHVFFDRQLTADSEESIVISVKYTIDWHILDRIETKKMLSKQLTNVQMNTIVSSAPAKSSLLISQMLAAANLPLVVLPPSYLGNNETT